MHRVLVLIIVLLGGVAPFFCLATSSEAFGQTYPPVQPDPWRGPRTFRCAEFVRTLAPLCNFNPATSGTRGSADCRTYRDNGGTVTIMCPEDDPRYAWLQRLAAVSRTCGENGIGCIGALFKREGDRCVYRVVPDNYPRGLYDVPVSSLPNEWRLLLFRQGQGIAHRSFESEHRSQERFALANVRKPYGQQDPCRYNSFQ